MTGDSYFFFFFLNEIASTMAMVEDGVEEAVIDEVGC